MLDLYTKAVICQTFPAYKLSDLSGDTPARDILRAMDLLSLAERARKPAK